jgi:CubicO group peptidase (beta-lactamase class C family)
MTACLIRAGFTSAESITVSTRKEMMMIRTRASAAGIAAATLLLFLLPGYPKSLTIPPPIEQSIQEYVRACDYSTLFVGLVDGKDQVALGFGKMANNKTADGSTQFEIGSLTQTFTALLLARDIGAGKLTPDTPLATLLPGYRIASKNGKLITVENLATQRSGLPWLPGNFSPARLDVPYQDYGETQLKEFFAAFSLVRDPGEAYEDSTLGIGTLGFALGRSAGDFEQRVTGEILTPLGMLQTRLAPRAWDRFEAPGHSAIGEFAGNSKWGVLAPAGTMISSGGDMLTYLQANMGTLHSALYDAMQLAQRARADGAAGSRIGLVWMTQHGTDTDVIWHHGITPGYASFLGFTADRRRGVVILASRGHAVDDLGFALLRTDGSAPAHRPAAALTEGQSDDYVGSYLLDRHFVVSVTRQDQQMLLEIPGRPMFLMYSRGGDEFALDRNGQSVSFRRNKGRVDQLILHLDGDRPAPRLSARQLASMQTHTPADVNRAVIGEYVGEYALEPDSKLSLKADGLALTGRIGQQAILLFPIERDRFVAGPERGVEFVRDESGRVVGLVLIQNGVLQRARRL